MILQNVCHIPIFRKIKGGMQFQIKNRRPIEKFIVKMDEKEKDSER